MSKPNEHRLATADWLALVTIFVFIQGLAIIFQVATNARFDTLEAQIEELHR